MLYLSMKGFVIGGHDALLNTTHDLLDSLVESSDQHSREPNRSHTWKRVELI